MLIRYLKSVPIFSHLSDARLKTMASMCKAVTFKKNEVVFYSTTESTDLYIVLSGRLKAVLIDTEGEEMVLARFKAGDFFGELSLIDGKGRSATIVADEDSSLAVLKRKDFMGFIANDPKAAIEMLATLAGRLRKADEIIESLAFLEVSERLMRTLLEIAQTDGEPCGGGIRIAKLTHRELASRIGASREAVSKCMKTFATEGTIKEDGSYIFIKACNLG